MPALQLPTREWIAKIEPKALETRTPNGKQSIDMRRATMIWIDEFDNPVELPTPPETITLSRKQRCRNQQGSAMSGWLTNGRLPPHRLGQSSTLVIDDCYTEGLVDGFDSVLMAAMLFAAIAIMAMGIVWWLKSWQARRKDVVKD
ncbi:hypothetical protein WHR41_06617 [Cladosporium halotolerans]|uniref:Uncharacterized protein n=1 Tax=Cladosporium halotolerans TaxID=1052096 RepID=A0AB34KLU0_9PEZI